MNKGLLKKAMFANFVTLFILISPSLIYAQSNPPIQITDCNGLQNMRNDRYGNYILMNDIDCSATKTWNNGQGFEPIGGNNTGPFYGKLDGQGYRITGLYINRSGLQFVGLFGDISFSRIQNLYLTDLFISGSGSSARVGGVVGRMNPGTIFNVHVQGIIKNDTFGGLASTGGLVGENLGNIRQTSAKVAITGNNSALGGLVGWNMGSSIISESFSDGMISENGNWNQRMSGGLVGRNSGIIRNSYSSLQIKSLLYLFPPACGGLVGENDTGRIENSYSIGLVKSLPGSPPSMILGGLIGYAYNNNSVLNSFWDRQTSGQLTSAGSSNSSGKTTAEMQTLNTFASWDFKNTWQMCANTPDYPRLKWEGEACHKKIAKSSVQASSPSIDGDEIYWMDVSANDPTHFDIFSYNLKRANNSSFHFNNSSSTNRNDFTPAVGVYNLQNGWYDSSWIDGRNIQLQGINWSEFSVAAQNSMNWSEFTVSKYAKMNWEDANSLSQAGINWGSIESISGPSGLNWSDTQVLQQACARPPINATSGINWTDLKVLANYTDLYIGSEFRGKGSQLNPDVSNRKVVWEDNIAGQWDVYMYDFVGNTIKRITPCVSTNIDVTHYKYPKIDGNKIVWQDFRNGNWDVFVYDGSNESLISAPSNTHQQFPDISGNKVAYLGNQDGGSDIYVYDIGTLETKRLTTVKADRSRPSISGNLVVWQDKRFGNWDIFLYDLSRNKEWQLTKNISDQMEPSISGNRVVWVDTRNRKKEIYIYEFPNNRPPVIYPIGNKTATEGQPLSFQVRASDPEGAPVCLTCELGDGQAISTMGANFTNLGVGTSGVFNWPTPTRRADNNDWFTVFKAYEAKTVNWTADMVAYSGANWTCDLVAGVNWTGDMVEALGDSEAVFINVTPANVDLTVTQYYVQPPAVGGMSVSQYTASMGDALKFTAQFKNQGQHNAGTHKLSFYIDDQIISAIDVPTLITGETRMITTPTPWTATAGAHGIKAMIDSGSVITETSESNNALIKSLLVAPKITSPAANSLISTSTVTFQWPAASGATQYLLLVGTQPNLYNIFLTSQTTNANVTVSGIPLLGNPIYVKLWTRISGRWLYTDQSFQTTKVNSIAELTSPSSITSTEDTYEWSAGNGVTQYMLIIGTTPYGRDLFVSPLLTSTSVPVTFSKTPESNYVYITLYSKIGNLWLSKSYQKRNKI